MPRATYQETGEGWTTLYLYGPDADRLFGAIEKVLRSEVLPADSIAVRRCGPADDPRAREVRVKLS